MVYYGDVDNMLSLRVVALMIQTNDTMWRGPQHRPSGWFLLPWPSSVVVTVTADHSTASCSAMTESMVEDTVDVVCEAPHWQLIATRLRRVRVSLLRSSATVLWTRAVAGSSMVLEVL